ncbi:isoprenylcysteine carboxylmethyltransferase family protein [Ferrovibrio terrae]|uniref:Isoprenylcysteine carboxylmethyltransferase family protein n=1 Tax=Ferrovibrio terrae TaxID=2594003 RepID=A0A516GZV8_9PROT|nr:isoprenylcysteine carboxylmethyltransferase family protein [Ferrovibrio terrae]QDO96870.1 isoprenylcysteine carboxylmethyltransferase family protein [Ferrovibrio terrae]
MAGLSFAAFAYLCFNLVTGALALFLTGLPEIAGFKLPITVDSSIWPPLSPWLAGAVDLGLIALFGLQHSVMARPGFKRWLTTFVPPHLERATYMFVSSPALLTVLLFWQPLPGMVWRSDDDILTLLLWALFGAGWLLLVAATWMIDHFELFGLAQAWRHWRGKPAPASDFRMVYAYRYMRHPIYTGWLITFWATPQMSVSHLLFAIGMSAYILVGIICEERDLIATFGDRYRAYRSRVPALIPGFKV